MFKLFKREKRTTALIINNELFNQEIVKNKKSAIVTFSAAWCGACKMQKPLINDLAHHHRDKDLLIAFVDVDVERELVQQFGIKSMPTTLVFNDGDIIFKKTGLLSRGNLEQIVTALEKTSL